MKPVVFERTETFLSQNEEERRRNLQQLVATFLMHQREEAEARAQAQDDA